MSYDVVLRTMYDVGDHLPISADLFHNLISILLLPDAKFSLVPDWRHRHIHWPTESVCTYSHTFYIPNKTYTQSLKLYRSEVTVLVRGPWMSIKI